MMQIQTTYRATELATLMSMERRRVLRWLLRTGVPVRRVGRVNYVLLSDLRGAFPQLWDSIVERAAVCGELDQVAA